MVQDNTAPPRPRNVTRRTAALVLGAGVAAPAPQGRAAAPAGPREAKAFDGVRRAPGHPTEILLFIGSQGGAPDGGIFAARFDEASGALEDLGRAAAADRATWLARAPGRPILFSVSEATQGEGAVLSFAVDAARGRLASLSRTSSGGRGPVHLIYDPDRAEVFAANYGDGRISAIPVQPDGRLGPAAVTLADAGSGPSPRQTGPHAHAVIIDPTGRHLLAADLGADRIFIYPFRGGVPEARPGGPAHADLPPGSGPRHLAFSRDGRFLFVSAELTARVHAFRWDPARGQLAAASQVQAASVSGASPPTAAEIALSPDGQRICVSVRGDDLLVVFALDRVTGALTEIQRIASGGRTPWSFAYAPGGRWLIVANTGSDALSVFAVDPQTGRLTPTGARLRAPRPSCLLFFGL